MGVGQVFLQENSNTGVFTDQTGVDQPLSDDITAQRFGERNQYQRSDQRSKDGADTADDADQDDLY